MTDDVLFDQEGQLGIITLNRPKALNALNLNMIQVMYIKLKAWASDTRVSAVVVQAVPGKAFCAGGDVRWLYEAGNNHRTHQMDFFQQEYQLNQYIADYPKPYISLLNGMTMGGGVGISLHGSHPLATEHFVFAMPETSIGFFPDIGASHLLSRCPGQVGKYLGLTGAKLNASDACQTGLVKATLPSSELDGLMVRLKQTDLSKNPKQLVEECINQCAPLDMDSTLDRTLIDQCYMGKTVEDIMSKLADRNEESARQMIETLGLKSPLSLKVTLAQIIRAKDLSLSQCLAMDILLAKHFMQGSDFYEGIRALLVDKDKAPKWHPPSLSAVTDEHIQSYFVP